LLRHATALDNPIMQTEPPKAEPPKCKRRWCSRHWLTWLALVVEGAAIARCQFIEQFYGSLTGSSFSYVRWSNFGWPVAHVEQQESGTWAAVAKSPPTFEYTWFYPSFAVNCVFWLLLVCSVGLVVEVWLRKPKRWQFTLRGLALLFAVTGAVLTSAKQQSLIDDGLSRLGMSAGLKLLSPFGSDLDWASIIVIHFGLVCLVYAIARIAIGVVARLLALIKPVSTLAVADAHRPRCAMHSSALWSTEGE
jgi:hypothetical protein